MGVISFYEVFTFQLPQAARTSQRKDSQQHQTCAPVRPGLRSVNKLRTPGRTSVKNQVTVPLLLELIWNSLSVALSMNVSTDNVQRLNINLKYLKFNISTNEALGRNTSQERHYRCSVKLWLFIIFLSLQVLPKIWCITITHVAESELKFRRWATLLMSPPSINISVVHP